MNFTRRKFITSAVLSGVGAALATSGFASTINPITKIKSTPADNPTYDRLDEILKKPVFKRELFTSPVIIESLELLRYKDNFICRVRSRDGLEGFSIWSKRSNEISVSYFCNQDAGLLYR